MMLKLYCNRVDQARKSNLRFGHLVLFAVLVLGAPHFAFAGDAPAWMHALVNASLPGHDERTDAVVLYAEESVNVISADKIKVVARKAYKILRPGGRDRAMVGVFLNPNRKVTSLHGWCIPSTGKDYEVKDKDAVEVSAPKIEGGELISDVKYRVIHIPAPDPGNVIGYEYEVEIRPLVLQQLWELQSQDPVAESNYSVQLPSAWEYKAAWINHPETQPASTGGNQWRWSLHDIKPIRIEESMPSVRGVAGHMVFYFYPPGGSLSNSFTTWQQMGVWYQGLTNGRTEASPEIKQKVVELTARVPKQLDKIRILAHFVQKDIRYVAIELGVGGLQPHAAVDVFTHHYGDCKDKATLLASMLREIGVDSYYVVINTERGSVTPDTPANIGFNHVILVIKLPGDASDPSLFATVQHAQLGRILFFDPTNQFTPFGQIGGYLQANFGLLVAPGGGELVRLPQQPSRMNGIQRTANLELAPSGRLAGSVEELRLGDRAWSQRAALLTTTREADRIKPIESVLAASLSNFNITKASLMNLSQTDLPFGFQYTFEATDYAKNAGDLILLRPCVLGRKSSGILETREPRHYPIEFEGPVRDTDQFEISLPAGYEVDELPSPVDADFSFASYHAKSELKGNVIYYTRTFEIKELSVPLNKADELKKFYRIVAGDERNAAVLKPSK
jgi:hypothetical protein